MEQKRPPQRQVKPVRPTFFLQDKHLFFFFLASLSPPSFPPSEPAIPPTHTSSLGRVGIVGPAVSREQPGSVWLAADELMLLTADAELARDEVLLLLPSSIERLAILPGVGAKDAGMFVGGACFFLT